MSLALPERRVLAGCDPFVVREKLPLEDCQPGMPLRRQLATITIAWMFGAIWFNVAHGAPMALLAEGLGASPLQFGILASLPYVAALFAVFGTLLTEWTGDRKRIFLNTHFLQRAVCLVVAIAPVLMLHWYGPAASGRAMTLVLALMFVMFACGSAGGPSWVSWMADVVPARVRGSYFARRRQWGIVTAVPAAVLIGVGLDKLAGPTGSSPLANVSPLVFWCCALLAVVSFFGMVDIALFQPIPHTRAEPRKGLGLLRAMATPLSDKPFLALSGFVGAINFTVGFTNTFATYFIIKRLGIDHLHAQLMLLILPMLLQWMLLPAWGAAVDKIGRKPLLTLACLGLVPMGFGWCLVGGNPWLGYILSAGGSALWAGIEVCNFNAVIEANGRKTATGQTGGSAYHTVNSLIINAAGCLGGLSAGAIASALSTWHWQPAASFRPIDYFDALFALSGTVRLAAVVMLAPLLHEPSAKGMFAAVRFILRHTSERVTRRAAAMAERLTTSWVRPSNENRDSSVAVPRSV